MVDEVPDATLVARCLEGDVEAFEPLVRRHQRALFNVALRMLGDREDARDVTQEAFLKAYRKLATFDPSYRFFSWIYRIVVNESLNVRGRRWRVSPLETEPAAPGRPDDGLRDRERQDRVQAALSCLTASDREVLVLRHFAELSYADIGAALGIAEKTVKSRLHEARQRLGRALEPGSAVR
jgi:RNA polymerase sigma-70 factor (ECF subfamily)